MKTLRSGILPIVFLLSIVLGSCHRQSELEGSWIGCEIHRPLLDWTLTIAGNQFSLERDDWTVWYKGFFELNKNCRLNKIDLEVVETAEQRLTGKTALGIYELDGKSLTIVANKPGEHLRPLSFDESGKSLEFYFTKNN